MTSTHTENFADFGLREICLLKELLDAWLTQGLPDNFYDTGIKPAMNKSCGYVFLTNEDYQVAMLNPHTGKPELFRSLPDSRIKGFLSDIVHENDPCHLG